MKGEKEEIGGEREDEKDGEKKKTHAYTRTRKILRVYDRPTACKVLVERDTRTHARAHIHVEKTRTSSST